MKKNNLLKTNLLISIILIIGFVLTAIFSYKANYQASLNNIEEVSALTAEGLYYRITTIFTKPVNISLTMARDSLLAEHLEAEMDHLEDSDYIEATKTYLNTYKKKYGFDSIFLVSTASKRYYNFNGVDRVLERQNQENDWYFDLLSSDSEYSLNVDNDEVIGAGNEITVFVNCKITTDDGRVLGVVGVGIRIDYLKELLLSYEDKYHVMATLVGQDGTIQLSTTYTGYERKDWFAMTGREYLRDQIFKGNETSENLEMWTSSGSQSPEESYVVTRYIPELSWNLIVEQNTGALIQEMQNQIYHSVCVLILVILTVLIIITAVIKNFNRQITELMEERQEVFKRATEQLYDNIYELNITHNRYEGKRTEDYFGSLGAEGLPYDQGLRVVAKKQIKPEYQEGYVATFSPENVIKEYESGNNHLQYDFMLTEDGANYHWIRIVAYVFHSSEDNSLHMFTYRKNIDAEKQNDLRASTDEMTGFLTKKATERVIGRLLSQNHGETYAFFIFDIDNFKQANDQFGHAFGDYCIREFTGIIKRHFREGDVLGRIGGDEFAAFIPVPDVEWARKKAEELTAALNTVCASRNARWSMSASIGVALSPRDGSDFDTLYRNADTAMYQTKLNGKKGFTIYQWQSQET